MIKMYFFLGYSSADLAWYFTSSIKLPDHMINRGPANWARVPPLFEHLRTGIATTAVSCVTMYDCSIFGLFHANDALGIVICVFWRSKSVAFLCHKWQR